MSELSRWSDDEVLELIAVARETAIEPFHDLYSFDLLFFGSFFRCSQARPAVDHR